MPLVCGKINQKILSFWTTYLSFCTRKMYPNTPVPEILCTAVLKGFFMEKYTGYSSDQISRSVVSDSLRPCESQHARPPCPSPTPGVHRDSRPWSQWCHPAVSSSVFPFSSCPQSLPASVFSSSFYLFIFFFKFYFIFKLYITVLASFWLFSLSSLCSIFHTFLSLKDTIPLILYPK